MGMMNKYKQIIFKYRLCPVCGEKDWYNCDCSYEDYVDAIRALQLQVYELQEQRDIELTLSVLWYKYDKEKNSE